MHYRKVRRVSKQSVRIDTHVAQRSGKQGLCTGARQMGSEVASNRIESGEFDLQNPARVNSTAVPFMIITR